jgi:hypothetical protein
MKYKWNKDTALKQKGNGIVITTIGEIERAIDDENIICLIKSWRGLTSSGLKDSKDKIEELLDRQYSGIGGKSIWDKSPECKERVIDAFIEVSSFPQMTKEEFMNLISDAIDHMDKFYCKNMIDACEFLFKGIKEQGGIEKIAEHRDNFLNGI